MASKWSRLLDVYSDIEDDPFWEYLRAPAGIRLVRGDGPESAEMARVLVVGEAPGARENGEGRPFVGPSGRVLDDLLGLAGLARQQVFVTNVVKYRPPGNRTPNPAETFHARDALRREWSIIDPLLTICVGSVAHGVMHPAVAMSLTATQRDPWPFRSKPGAWCVSEYHPAYGLRSPKVQPIMEEDWERLGAWIKENLQEVL